MNKFQEILEELKLVFSKRGAGIFDAVIPLLFFIIGSRFLSLQITIIISLSIAFIILAYRIIKKQSVGFIAGGTGLTLLAVLLAYISGTAEGYYLPGFITGGLTVLACIISVWIKRPLAAYSSKVTRRWPMEWYWHMNVRPAYTEVTIFWGISFLVRLVLEIVFYLQKDLTALGNTRLIMGWPYTILVLVISYMYGQRRLRDLKGPSIEEFKQGKQPPWEGQLRGF